MELLRESGVEFKHNIHELAGTWMEALMDYPPFVEEFIRPKG